MTYVLIAALFLSTALLVACTNIFLSFDPGQEGEVPPAVSIQTANNTSVLSAQNTQKDDKASRGDSTSSKGDSRQEATSVPVVPITAPISLP